MAKPSVATPQISIPAQMFLDRYNDLQDLIECTVGAAGVLTLLNEEFDSDTPENCALTAALRLVRECRAKACAMDWPIGYEAEAKQALGIEETQ